MRGPRPRRCDRRWVAAPSDGGSPGRRGLVTSSASGPRSAGGSGRCRRLDRAAARWGVTSRQWRLKEVAEGGRRPPRPGRRSPVACQLHRPATGPRFEPSGDLAPRARPRAHAAARLPSRLPSCGSRGDTGLTHSPARGWRPQRVSAAAGGPTGRRPGHRRWVAHLVPRAGGGGCSIVRRSISATAIFGAREKNFAPLTRRLFEQFDTSDAVIYPRRQKMVVKQIECAVSKWSKGAADPLCAVRDSN